MTPPEQPFSLAADLSSVIADENLPQDVRSAAASLALMDRAKRNGATWAVIGKTLGISGREAKKRAHGLREKVRRAQLLARVMDEELPRYAEALERPGESP